MPHVRIALPTAIVVAGLAALPAGCSQTEGGAKVAVSATSSPVGTAPAPAPTPAATAATASAQSDMAPGTAGAPLMAAVPVPQPAPREIAHAKTGLDGLIERYAAYYEVPSRLVRRVVERESKGNPRVYSKGNWGLMQIKYPTARSLGFDGPADALLDAETNLKYAVKYLRGAYMVADGDEDRAVRYYAAGYYNDAKRKGLLEETGLRPGDPGADAKPAPAVLMASLEAPAASAAGFVPSDAPVAAAGAGVVNPTDPTMSAASAGKESATQPQPVIAARPGGAVTTLASAAAYGASDFPPAPAVGGANDTASANVTLASASVSPKAARVLPAVSTSSRMQGNAGGRTLRAGIFGQPAASGTGAPSAETADAAIGQAFVAANAPTPVAFQSPSAGVGAGTGGGIGAGADPAVMAYAAFEPAGPVPVPTPAPGRP